jgi:hypothetical protein
MTSASYIPLDAAALFTDCDERDRLARALTSALSDNVRAVLVLETRKRRLTLAEDREIRRCIKTARLRAKLLRLDLRKHVAEHGC